MSSHGNTKSGAGFRLAFSSLQWAFFLLTGGLVAPIVVASAFQLSEIETVELLQRTLILIGLSSVLQVTLGHKLPILEGPAGVWWGIFVLLAGSVSSKPESFTLLRQLEMGLMISGCVLVLLSVFHVISHVKKLFTPVVIGTYLLLLIFQFSSSVVKGMLGVGYLDAFMHARIALPAIATLVFTFLCARMKIAFMRNYSVLFGVVFGCTMFKLLGLIPPLPALSGSFTRPALFAWGTPELHSGILVTTIVVSLPLLINMIAAIVIMEKTLGRTPGNTYRRAGLVMGINQLLAGLFSAVGCVSNSHTAGFVASTQITKRLPLLIGCFIVICAGLFPAITLAMASIPVPVAFAVIFSSFTHLLVSGLREYEPVLRDDNKVLIISISLFAGVGSMFVPSASLAAVPAVWKPILNNGLLIGVLTSMALEQMMRLIKIWQVSWSTRSGAPVHSDRSAGHRISE
jgi:xanthine/uracil permease